MFRKAQERVEAQTPPDQAAFADPTVPSRACCCPARPVVRVMMPPTATRPRPVDLWLCGHHYRASLVALLASGATAEELTITTSQSPVEHTSGPAGTHSLRGG